MDEIDLTLPDDVIVIVVPRLRVRPQPSKPDQGLTRRERFIVDLPDREVWIASTRSSTVGAYELQVHPDRGGCDDDGDGNAASELHR